MGKRKITCNNSSCKHYRRNGECDTCITITSSGKCGSYEKGFIYYFHIVWDALGRKNFIDAVEFNYFPELEENDVTYQFNVAKVCDMLSWCCKDWGILNENGFHLPNDTEETTR